MTQIINQLVSLINDNQGVVNLLVGFIGLSAIWIYRKQSSDYKRNVAKLILQEIRYAEQKIRDFKKTNPNQYKLSDKLLPTNSWHNNIHLFVEKLKETPSIDLISDFYSRANYIDKLIDIISDQKNNPMPRTSSPEKVYMPVVSPTQQILKEVSEGTEFIYNTTVVERLREISEKKWWHIFK